MVTRKRCRLCNHEDRESLESDLETMICSPDDLDIRMNWPSGTSAKHQRNHMEGYADASNPRCKLCTYENRSEIEQELNKYSKKKIIFNFTPHLTPMFRGILSTIYVQLDSKSSVLKIHKLLLSVFI